MSSYLIWYNIILLTPFQKLGTTVFLNTHAPGWNKWYPYMNMRNYAVLEKLLEGYDVHVFCGHSHFFQNVDVNEHLYQHNVGAACGALWWGNVNRCGAPNGYMCNKQIKTHLFFVKLNHQPIFLYFQLVSCQKWFVCFPFYSLFP